MGNVLTKLNQIIMILINMVELGKAKRIKIKKYDYMLPIIEIIQ